MENERKSIEARKKAAGELFKTLRNETARPASKRRRNAIEKATTLAALLYLEARHALKCSEKKINLTKDNEKQ